MKRFFLALNIAVLFTFLIPGSVFAIGIDIDRNEDPVIPDSSNPFNRQLERDVVPELRQAGGSEFIAAQGSQTNFILFVIRWVQIAMTFLGLAVVGGLVYAGFLWMTAAGNDEQVDKAKKYLRNGVIGLILILSSYSIAWWLTQQIQLSTGATGRGSGGSIFQDRGGINPIINQVPDAPFGENPLGSIDDL